jgi:hypothetical protein
LVRKAEASRLGDEPIFLFDEDLIAHGKTLKTIYPEHIHISSLGEAPSKATPDGVMYSWCLNHGAIFVTGDFNMLRDEAVLKDLLSRVGLRVIWVRQIKGQSLSREIERIVGRWTHIRKTVMEHPELMGFVLTGNGQLIPYRSISDAVVQVANRQRGGREP